MFDNFWDEFEDQCAKAGLVSKVPICMKQILTACGYNNAWAFKEITDARIQELETFVQSQHRKLADSFDEYKKIDPLKFLPGHRTMIKGVQTEILSMEATKKTKASQPSSKTKTTDDLSEDTLKNMLIDQVAKYSLKKSLNSDWSNSIEKFSMKTNDNGTSAECTLSCPMCGVVRIIRFDNHWTPSNMFKHLKTHVKVQKNVSDETNLTTNSGMIQSINDVQQTGEISKDGDHNSTAPVVFVDEHNSNGTDEEWFEEVVYYDGM